MKEPTRTTSGKFSPLDSSRGWCRLERYSDAVNPEARCTALAHASRGANRETGWGGTRSAGFRLWCGAVPCPKAARRCRTGGSMTAPTARRLIPLLISALLLLACASTAPPPPVAAVTIAPVTTEIVIGASVQLTATTWDASGRVLQGRDVTWTHSDPTGPWRDTDRRSIGRVRERTD